MMEEDLKVKYFDKVIEIVDNSHKYWPNELAYEVIQIVEKFKKENNKWM